MPSYKKCFWSNMRSVDCLSVLPFQCLPLSSLWGKAWMELTLDIPGFKFWLFILLDLGQGTSPV